MQFADFVSCAWDHLVTVAAKQRCRAGTPVPIVRAAPVGRRLLGRAVPLAEPGVARSRTSPGSSASARRRPRTRRACSISAIEDPNPVLYFEHKHLYRRIKGEVPDERYTTPIGKARIHREGDDITRRDVGRDGLHGRRGRRSSSRSDDISVEIVDLRTIMPWDKAAVLEQRAQDVEGARPARGHAHRRLRRRDRGHDRRGGVRGPRRAPCGGSRRPTRRCRSRPRSRRRSSRRSTDVVAGLRELAEY